jgi:TM2 domain-containing membrane protein YozV
MNCGNKQENTQAFCDKCGSKAGTGGTGGASAPYHSYPPQYGQYPHQVISIREKSTGTATVLSLFIVGLGQIYVGRIGRGLALLLAQILISVVGLFVWFGASLFAGFAGFAGGWIAITAILIAIWAFNLYDANKLANEYNDALRATGQRPW